MTSLGKKALDRGCGAPGRGGLPRLCRVQQGWVYYVPVDKFVTDAAQQKHRVRLMGTVGGQDLLIEAAQLSGALRPGGQRPARGCELSRGDSRPV